MSYITEQEYKAAVQGYDLIAKVIEAFAEDYGNKFLGVTNFSLEDFDLPFTEDGRFAVDGEMTINYEVFLPRCCGSEWESCSVPIDYLWDDHWIGREKERRAEQRRQREKKEAEQRAQKEKERQEQRYQQYLKMKEEFENVGSD